VFEQKRYINKIKIHEKWILNRKLKNVMSNSLFIIYETYFSYNFMIYIVFFLVLALINSYNFHIDESNETSFISWNHKKKI